MAHKYVSAIRADLGAAIERGDMLVKLDCVSAMVVDSQDSPTPPGSPLPASMEEAEAPPIPRVHPGLHW